MYPKITTKAMINIGTSTFNIIHCPPIVFTVTSNQSQIQYECSNLHKSSEMLLKKPATIKEVITN